jgi:HK97 family phage major capsid protein
MDITKQIKLKRDERAAHVAAMELLMKTAQDEERGFTDEEQTDFDSNESMIKTVDIEIKNFERMESVAGKAAAQPVTEVKEEKSVPAGAGARAKGMHDPKLFLARQAHALFMTQGNRGDAAEYAKSIGDDEMSAILRVPSQVMEKATVAVGDSVTSGWAAELTTIQQANSSFIEMLRAASIVARFPGRQMEFAGDSSIVIPRQTAGAKGAFIGQNKAIPVGKLAFDDLTLTPKKAAIIVPATNELLSKSSPSALMLIQDDIIAGTGETIDSLFVSTTAGVANVSPAGLLVGAATSASAGATLANVDTDMKTMINSLIAANVPFTRPVWIMNPIRLNSLAHLRDGAGGKAFPEIANGMLGSFPVITSTNVTDSVVVLTDASQVIIASDYAPVLSISEDATLVLDSTSINIGEEVDAAIAGAGGAPAADRISSMYQQDAVAIRLKMAIDWGHRHVAGTYMLTGVAW